MGWTSVETGLDYALCSMLEIYIVEESIIYWNFYFLPVWDRIHLL